MSKKAKKTQAKGRKTRLENVKAELHNEKAYGQRLSEQITDLENTVAVLMKERDELRETRARNTDEIMRRGQAINDLKQTIAGLEKDLSYEQGVASTLVKQIDQAAEKVMIKPPVMVSPDTAQQYLRPAYVADGEPLRRMMDTEGRTPKKHWTAL